VFTKVTQRPPLAGTYPGPFYIFTAFMDTNKMPINIALLQKAVILTTIQNFKSLLIGSFRL
jgi:hypothetical protein